MTYIGDLIKERMLLFGITNSQLANKTLQEPAYIEKIINDGIPLEHIDTFDFDLICNVLHCRPEYFTNQNIRDKDFVNVAAKKNKNIKTLHKIAMLQDFLNDFNFIKQI